MSVVSKMLNIKCLGSSSKGNCYIIKAGEDRIILEAGFKAKEIMKACDYNYRSIAGCLITHEHGDHAKYAKELALYGVKIYSSKGTLEAIGMTRDLQSKALEVEKGAKIGNFFVTPLNARHDAKEPFSYIIQHPEITAMIFLTDSFFCEYDFSSTCFEYIMIECNHQKKHIKPDDPRAKRLATSHLSLEVLKDTLRTWDLSFCNEIMLLHPSFDNCNQMECIDEIKKLTGIPTRFLKGE